MAGTAADGKNNVPQRLWGAVQARIESRHEVV